MQSNAWAQLFPSLEGLKKHRQLPTVNCQLHSPPINCKLSTVQTANCELSTQLSHQSTANCQLCQLPTHFSVSSSHLKYSLCHAIPFCGCSTQWFSLGRYSSFAFTL